MTPTPDPYEMEVPSAEPGVSSTGAKGTRPTTREDGGFDD